MKTLLPLLAVALLLPASKLAAEGEPFVSAHAKATQTAAPDFLVWRLEIHSVSATMDESRQQNQRALDQLKRGFSEMGLLAQDIVISQRRQGREDEHENGRRIDKGFFTEVAITVTLKDLALYEQVVSKVLSDDAVEVQHMEYRSSREIELRRTALAEAVRVAKEKAAIIAQSAGKELGEPLEIMEVRPGDSRFEAPNYSNTIRPADDRESSFERVEASARVEVKYSLK